MKDDKFRYTKFGLVNSLLSLIPIFPAWTLFPGVLFGKVIGDVFHDCELGYSITLWTCFALTAFLLFRYFNRFEVNKSEVIEKPLKMDFRLFSLGIYTLLNTIILIMIIGTNLACYGDGQTLLACIYSGPLAGIGLILLGVMVDIKRRRAMLSSVHFTSSPTNEEDEEVR